MFAGTLLQVLQTSFLSSRLSFPCSIIVADGRQLEDLACSPLVGLKRGGGVLLLEHNAGSTLHLFLLLRWSLPSPESPLRKAFIITLIFRGPFTTC